MHPRDAIRKLRNEAAAWRDDAARSLELAAKNPSESAGHIREANAYKANAMECDQRADQLERQISKK